MRRRLFTILSAMSLLMCVATVVLWVRSYWLHDMWSWTHSGYIQLHSQSGLIQFTWGIHTSDPPKSTLPYLLHGLRTFWVYDARRVDPAEQWPAITNTMTVYWNRAGFISAGDEKNVLRGTHYHLRQFPYWFPALLFAILPALHLRAMLRSRKLRRRGLCPVCGYDLRATPDRCPECGAVPEKVPT